MFRLGREPELSHREVLTRDSYKHVWLRASARGLPNRQVLYVAPEQQVRFRALALGPPNREVLIRDYELHVWLRR